MKTKFSSIATTFGTIEYINPDHVVCVRVYVPGKNTILAIELSSGREIYAGEFGSDEDAVENCLIQLGLAK